MTPIQNLRGEQEAPKSPQGKQSTNKVNKLIPGEPEADQMAFKKSTREPRRTFSKKTHMYIHTYMSVCTFWCSCICICICICACTCIYTCMSWHIHIQMHMCEYVYMCILRCECAPLIKGAFDQVCLCSSASLIKSILIKCPWSSVSLIKCVWSSLFDQVRLWSSALVPHAPVPSV